MAISNKRDLFPLPEYCSGGGAGGGGADISPAVKSFAPI